MKFTKTITRSEKQGAKTVYANIILSIIEDATACELLDRVGAEAIHAWALSFEGQYYLNLAGLVPNEKTALLLKRQVLIGARLNLMCVD